MDHGSIASAARDLDLAIAGHPDPVVRAVPPDGRPALLSCWWCGSEMGDGAVFLSFRRRGQLCCRDCAETLDVPGLYLG